MTRHHVVIYSGGMDSFTLLNWVRVDAMRDPLQVPGVEQEQQTLTAVSFNYGQRHKKELRYAARVCSALGIAHKIIQLDVLRELARGSALTDNVPVPHGHYAADNMKTTVVPGRNMVMLALAASYAEGMLAEGDRAVIYYGAHAGDHTIYPDCRPSFIQPMICAVSASSDARVGMRAPFMDIDKTAILRRGLSLGLDYTNTWSCYEGGDKPCGKCGACQERAEAFALNNFADPALQQTEHPSLLAPECAGALMHPPDVCVRCGAGIRDKCGDDAAYGAQFAARIVS